MADEKTVDSTDVLAIAQKVHDEYVNDGKRKHDEIVAEAESSRLTIIKDAEIVAQKLIDEATLVKQKADEDAKDVQASVQKQVDERMQELETENTKLKEKISKLQEFEMSYRNKLKKMVAKAYDSLDEETISVE